MRLANVWMQTCRKLWIPEIENSPVLSFCTKTAASDTVWKDNAHNRGHRVKGKRDAVYQRDTHGRSRHVAAVMQRLKSVARDRQSISHEQFLEICKAISGRRQGANLAHLCIATGVVFHHQGLVYPSVHSIQTSLKERLPIRVAPTLHRLQEVKAELAALEGIKRNLDHVAYIGVRRLFLVGLMAVIFQLLFFMRLTYVELSWDVMEPVAFYTTVAITLASYSYFLMTYRLPKYAHMNRSLQQKRREMLYHAAGFSLDRYERLQSQIKVYETFLTELSKK